MEALKRIKCSCKWGATETATAAAVDLQTRTFCSCSCCFHCYDNSWSSKACKCCYYSPASTTKRGFWILLLVPHFTRFSLPDPVLLFWGTNSPKIIRKPICFEQHNPHSTVFRAVSSPVYFPLLPFLPWYMKQLDLAGPLPFPPWSLSLQKSMWKGGIYEYVSFQDPWTLLRPNCSVYFITKAG